MTKKKLVDVVESLAKGDFSKIDLRRRDLGDCYVTYSANKSRAYWCDINEFDKVVKEFEKCSNDVEKYVCIPSHNTMMFTLFQCVYFWKDGNLYASYRYDTPSKTIQAYFILSKFNTLVIFRDYDFDTFKRIYLDKINK